MLWLSKNSRSPKYAEVNSAVGMLAQRLVANAVQFICDPNSIYERHYQSELRQRTQALLGLKQIAVKPLVEAIGECSKELAPLLEVIRELGAYKQLVSHVRGRWSLERMVNSPSAASAMLIYS